MGYLPRVLFFNAFELGAAIKILKQKRASKSKYATLLSLNHFL
jgi:hypothetical protein